MDDDGSPELSIFAAIDTKVIARKMPWIKDAVMMSSLNRN